jgi:signal transduction histidine kinase
MRSETGSLARSAALRGALWITLIALITTGAALTLQYVGTARLIEARQHALVDDEATALLGRYRDGGVLGVAGAIERAQKLPRINEFFYLLADPAGTPLAGNLVAWPANVEEPGYHTFTTEVVSTGGQPRQRRVEARAVLLEGGFRLLVGSLSDEQWVLRERYVSSILWSFLATGVLGLLLGFWYSRRGLAFLAAATATGERFLAGRLEERLPVSGVGDEYDRLAETINRSFEEVERLVSSLRAATDGLAHDLKTPLTRIRARLELAQIENATTGRLREVVTESRQDLDGMLRLIEKVLTLARAEETGGASFEWVRLDTIVAEAVELFEPVAEDKGVRLLAQINPVRMMGSPTLLAQAATNLLDNAIKYTPVGGEVRISLESGEEFARLTVADTGPGIPAELREKALLRFARLDASRSQPGSGLGLSIVSAAARAHRGMLTLSAGNPGLVVEISFKSVAAKAASVD